MIWFSFNWREKRGRFKSKKDWGVSVFLLFLSICCKTTCHVPYNPKDRRQKITIFGYYQEKPTINCKEYWCYSLLLYSKLISLSLLYRGFCTAANFHLAIQMEMSKDYSHRTMRRTVLLTIIWYGNQRLCIIKAYIQLDPFLYTSACDMLYRMILFEGKRTLSFYYTEKVGYFAWFWAWKLAKIDEINAYIHERML